MAEELKEREVFEAHMRVGGYSNPDKHPDGSYVSSAMELWWQGWKARAQLPSRGGEAVAWRVPVREGGKRTSFYTEALPFVPGIGVAVLGDPVPLYTHPADQVAEGVVVSRELLDSLMTVIDSNGYAADEVEVVDELRALLAKP